MNTPFLSRGRATVHGGMTLAAILRSMIFSRRRPVHLHLQPPSDTEDMQPIAVEIMFSGINRDSVAGKFQVRGHLYLPNSTHSFNGSWCRADCSLQISWS